MLVADMSVSVSYRLCDWFEVQETVTADPRQCWWTHQPGGMALVSPHRRWWSLCHSWHFLANWNGRLVCCLVCSCYLLIVHFASSLVSEHSSMPLILVLGSHWPRMSGNWFGQWKWGNFVDVQGKMASILRVIQLFRIYRSKWWWKWVTVREEELIKHYIIVVVASEMGRSWSGKIWKFHL